MLALLLVVTIMFTFHATAFAAGLGLGTSQKIQGYSFLDAEGKVNTVHVTSERVGSAHVDYYIGGVLINSVDVETIKPLGSAAKSVGSSDEVRISFTDYQSNETTVITESLSKYFADAGVSNDSAGERGYTYIGSINYNTYIDSFGYEYNDKLRIYIEDVGTTYEYKTINTTAGTVASVAIGVLATVLTGYAVAIGVIVESLFLEAAISAGASIVGGIVQSAFSKRYYVQISYYNVRADDFATLRQRFYTGDRYRVALEGGGYSSAYYYEGYMPWNSSAVAYWMFCDFWVYTYPGVKSYS